MVSVNNTTSEHSSFSAETDVLLFLPTTKTTPQQPHHHHHTNHHNVPASFDGAVEQRTIVARSAFGTKTDVVSAQPGAAAIVQTHVFFAGQTTTAGRAMASPWVRVRWEQENMVQSVYMYFKQDKSIG